MSLISLVQSCHRTNRKGPNTLKFRWYCTKNKILIGNGGKITQMFNNQDPGSKQYGMDRPAISPGIINIMGIDSDQAHFLVF